MHELKSKKIKYDKETKKWFVQNPSAETTVWKCSKCGLYFKPTLGHKCEKESKR